MDNNKIHWQMRSWKDTNQIANLKYPKIIHKIMVILEGMYQRSKYCPFEINLLFYHFGVQKLSVILEGKYQRSKYNPFEINLPYYPLAAKTIHNIMVILEGKCQRSKYNPFVIYLPYHPFCVQKLSIISWSSWKASNRDLSIINL